ncbi:MULTISPECIES: DoxX family membrane protein [Gulosibacter]|uniref:DoxX family membrane protein n=1 Tax=Gulosibacter TaxID=256818 RepID=UPI000F63F83B|nr:MULTISPECIES: DoxX family membrane protein [Gulosibacter]
MRWYRWIVRVLFAVIFIGGGIAHFVLGRTQPDSYAAFADTALFPWLTSFWHSSVMPNIGWLTIALGVFELACGAGILWRRTERLAIVGMIAFLVFITVLGYGFPAETVADDLLANRLITIGMIVLLLPLLFAPRRSGTRASAGTQNGDD